MDCLDIFLIILKFLIDIQFQLLPELVEPGQYLQHLPVFILLMDFVQHSISALNMGFDKLWVCLVIILILLTVLVDVQLLIFAYFVSFASEHIVDQDVVQVLKILQAIDDLILVPLLNLVASDDVGVLLHIEHLQAILHVLAQVRHRVVQVLHFVLSE